VRLTVFGCGTIGGGGDTFPRKSRTKVVLVASERTGPPQLAVRSAVLRAAEQSVHPRFDLGSKVVACENRVGVLAGMEPRR
jgi:hypothetical protein